MSTQQPHPIDPWPGDREASLSGADQTQYSKPPADLDTLVHLYGDAMQRIGRLESQIERLSVLIEGLPQPSQLHALKTPAAENSGLSDLLERLQALEDLSAKGAGLNRENGGHPDNSQGGAIGDGSNGSEVAQMRAACESECPTHPGPETPSGRKGAHQLRQATQAQTRALVAVLAVKAVRLSDILPQPFSAVRI